MQEMIRAQKPRLSVKQARLTDLTFESLVIALDVKIHNPNPIGLTMQGFDYDLAITGSSFLTGKQNRSMTIPAEGESILEIPVGIQFVELYNVFKTLKNRDNAPYRIACGLIFDIPVLGRTRIPVSHSGTIPTVQLPSLRIAGLKVNNLSFSGADLELRMRLRNPNAFGLSLRALDYDFLIDGNRWARGISRRTMSVPRNGTGTIAIPISLDFRQMGGTLYAVLSGDEELNYNLSGVLDLGTTLPLLTHAQLPIDKSGYLEILK
jgi:LEA14-like dessication related protein